MSASKPSASRRDSPASGCRNDRLLAAREEREHRADEIERIVDTQRMANSGARCTSVSAIASTRERKAARSSVTPPSTHTGAAPACVVEQQIVQRDHADSERAARGSTTRHRHTISADEQHADQAIHDSRRYTATSRAAPAERGVGGERRVQCEEHAPDPRDTQRIAHTVRVELRITEPRELLDHRRTAHERRAEREQQAKIHERRIEAQQQLAARQHDRGRNATQHRGHAPVDRGQPAQRRRDDAAPQPTLQPQQREQHTCR